MFPLSSLQITGNTETSFPFVCKQGRWCVFGPPLPHHLSLPLPFLHPVLLDLSCCATQPKLPSTVPYQPKISRSSDTRCPKLCCCFLTPPPNVVLPSLVASLLAMGSAWESNGLTASSGVRGARPKAHPHTPWLRSQDQVLLEAGLVGQGHGTWGRLGAWEQPADHQQKDLAPHCL